MLVALALSTVLSLPSTSCVTGSRGEPVLWIKDDMNGKSHFIHMLEWEEAQCDMTVKLIEENKLTYACGCKQLIYLGMRDRIRLKCAYLPEHGTIKSRRIAIYYYYDDGQSPAACNRLRSIIMGKRRRRGRWW